MTDKDKLFEQKNEEAKQKLIEMIQNHDPIISSDSENRITNHESINNLLDILPSMGYLSQWMEAIVMQAGINEESGLLDVSKFEEMGAVMEEEDKNIPISLKILLNNFIIPMARLMYYNQTSNLIVGIDGVISKDSVSFFNASVSHEAKPTQEEAMQNLSSEELDEIREQVEKVH